MVSLFYTVLMLALEANIAYSSGFYTLPNCFISYHFQSKMDLLSSKVLNLNNKDNCPSLLLEKPETV